MTSYVLKAHEERGALPETWRRHPYCPFCEIIYGTNPAYKVYEDEKTIAILGPSQPF